ncbi:probable BAT1- branched chain amino acid aminotransferase, mitochondrial [Melanopsichium pennsylvanicum]|uniref:Branched-chain-amino-acid aminotransferase n=2 Tax=Melanopsichium pennsylvanicum TaxID=63383 RepID=A0AAJ4XPY9_9BASI|nr:probable BAT1-branched chain amino acid aminotransferase, mitochondrial [Melanopsichium pennsylvanicum 4]SNX86645.1 probable BAT1- branched chain amino acid aminotransferase, mitochondrial [Melanopsichium pennsylvanicum]
MIAFARSTLRVCRASTRTPLATTPLVRFQSTNSISHDPMTGEAVGSKHLDASSLIITRSNAPRTPPPSQSLVFGANFSDHMLSVPWNSATGWDAPKIHPYAPLQLDPSAVIFHYAPSLFEGMKAYKDVNGNVRLFRPDMNMKRMNTSAARIALPTFQGEQLITLIKKLVGLDKGWIPSEPGHSLYIRPALIGTEAALGVHPTKDALLFVICSPVGPYYKTGFKPVALEADPNKVRAWPGGTGQYKLGGNYAPGILPQLEAAQRGYQQNLWLFGKEHLLTEVGTMNLFVSLKKADHIELVTPPLNGMILPGVTRDSILHIANDHISGKYPLDSLPNNLKVSQREISIHEVMQAGKSGELMEMFGAGTAAVVSPVDRVGYNGKDIIIPAGDGGIGPIAKAMLDRITDIQLGKVDHPWSVVVQDV